MPNLSETVEAKSDQLNADDLIGGPRDIIIRDVRGVSGDQPIAVYFEGDNGKPWMPCKTMRRLLIAVWGSDGKAYVGRSMRLYRDPEVKFGGMKVGGIRVSHVSHINEPINVPLTVTRGRKAMTTVRPLEAASRQRSGPSSEDAYKTAESHAQKGSDAFRSWWATDQGRSMRHLIKPRLDDLQKIAKDADEADSDEDPFANQSSTSSQPPPSDERDAAADEARIPSGKSAADTFDITAHDQTKVAHAWKKHLVSLDDPAAMIAAWKTVQADPDFDALPEQVRGKMGFIVNREVEDLETA